MIGEGSAQLRRYLRMRRAGTPTEAAAEMAGFSLAEARLTDVDEAKGLLAHIDITEPAPAVTGNPETDMPKRGAPAEPDLIDPSPEEALIELASVTLRGDTRDALLAWIKAQPKGWMDMAEIEQRDLAAAADRFATSLVRQVCQIIAAGERPAIVAKLEQYAEKDGVKAVLKLPSTGEVVAALHEACGREVLVVTSGAEDFMDQRGDAQIDPDQREMHGIGAEYDVAA